MYNLEQILNKLNIKYKTTGVNVKRGNINIKCPYCLDDPSYHMGIDPERGIYGCWRVNNHKGNNLVKLLHDKTGIPYGEIRKYFPNNIFKFKKHKKEISKDSNFFSGFDERFEPLDPFMDSLIQQQYLSYLFNRFDFLDKDDLATLCMLYNLRYSLHYPWKTRLLFPVTYKGEYVSMTSRAIGLNEPRYLHLSDASSMRSIKDCLYNFDNALNSEEKDILFVVEGVFDAINLDFIGRFAGCRAVALFNTIMTDLQLPLLLKLASGFNKIFVMFDSDSYTKALKLLSSIEPFTSNAGVLMCPKGFKDPAEMHRTDVIDLLEGV